MSSRKIIVLAIILPTLGATVYSFKYSGKTCGGIHANEKEYLCPNFYECVLESNKPNALGVCRFLPNGLRLWRQNPQGNEVVETPPQNDPTVEYDVQTKRAQRLTLAHNKFGFELLKALAYSDKTNVQNIAVSPTGVGLALDVLYSGSNGPTKDQMSNVLQLGGFSLLDLSESSKFLLDRLNTPVRGITTGFSNSIWVREGVSLSSAIKRDAQANFGVYITDLDFNQPESSQTINDWVRGNNAGKFENVVSRKIDPLDMSYIIDTAYFNGTWKYRFNPEKTEEREFLGQDGSKSPVKSMKMEQESFLYLENDTSQMVKLPYGQDEKYSMVVILPKDLGINDLLGKFDSLNWQDWINGLEKRQGTLFLPRYQVEYKKSITEDIKGVGMILPFYPMKADFSKLSEDGVSKDFYIENVLHSTIFEISEEGTQEPPEIVIKLDKRGRPIEPKVPPFTMDVNKPFFFAVINDETRANLFIGIVRKL